MAGAACVTAAVISLIWAIVPVRTPTASLRDWTTPQAAPVETAGGSPAKPAFDASVFQVRLWNAPVQSESAAASKEEALPPPPNLELIAIITESERLVAALYEVGADQLHMVSRGDHVGRLEIGNVDARGVDLRDGSRTFRLALTPAPAEPGTRLTLGQHDGSQP
jgi:hypothetical protein